ncbi:MAG TPA: glycosyltransferase [Candidatus Polarisedimenticolia bacterium]|nr:glycosyltransferase [Candidatus Polarisedimenticolia bacterium]
MRIAYAVSLFPKLSETFILREILELQRRGHEMTILSLKRDRETIVHEEAEPLMSRALYPAYGAAMAGSILYWLVTSPLRLGTTLVRLVASHGMHPRTLVKSLAVVPAALLFARRLAAARVEHVHAHWATYPATMAWIISRLTKIPFSMTGHAHDLFLPNPTLGLKVQDAVFVATISEFNRALLIQKCGPAALDKIRLIRCGLPLEQFPFGPRRAENATPRVISVGRLVDYKGFDVLIRACALLRDRGRPLECVIVGDGPERSRLEAMIRKLKLDGVVRLEGSSRQHEVARRISRADVLALACVAGADGQQDGIPIVLMEAMALGVPVISSKLSGIPELVVDNRTGILVAPGDDTHLAAGIERLLGDAPLAETLRLAARSMIEKEFDLRHSVDQLCAEFAASAERRAGGTT